VQQCRRRYDDSISDKAANAIPQDSRWHKMKNRFLIANDQGMPRIVPPLKTNNRLCSIRQEIDDLTFAFVTPLRTEDNDILPQ
jgi:hypothetical protein